MAELDLPGGEPINIEDEALFDRLKAGRDALKAETREARAELEELQKQQAKAQADAQRLAEEKQKAEKAAEVKRLEEAGEHQKAMELRDAQHKAEISTLTSQLIKGEVKDAVRGYDGVVPSAVDDIVSALSSKFRRGEDGSLATEAGTGVQDELKQYLDTRPHLLNAKLPAGGSGAPAGGTLESQTKITQADLNAAMGAGGKRYQELSEGISNGSVVVVE